MEKKVLIMKIEYLSGEKMKILIDRTKPIFRRSYAMDAFAEALIRGRKKLRR